MPRTSLISKRSVIPDQPQAVTIQRCTQDISRRDRLHGHIRSLFKVTQTAREQGPAGHRGGNRRQEHREPMKHRSRFDKHPEAQVSWRPWGQSVLRLRARRALTQRWRGAAADCATRRCATHRIATMNAGAGKNLTSYLCTTGLPMAHALSIMPPSHAASSSLRQRRRSVLVIIPTSVVPSTTGRQPMPLVMIISAAAASEVSGEIVTTG